MKSEEKKLQELSDYLDNIKKYAYKDIYHLENQVLNKNPYTSNFIKKYLYSSHYKNPNLLFIMKKIFLYYVKSFIKFFIYLITFLLFTIKFKKKNFDFDKKVYLIDVFFTVDKIINEQQFNEKYFAGLYDVLEKHDVQYLFLPRLYGIESNPFKIIQLLNILNDDKNIFLYEYQLLSIKDLFSIFIFIFIYPFKTMKLMQRKNNPIDKLFNYEIINSLPNVQFTSYIRHIIGKKIAKKLASGSKIISWQEFQNMEKTFNKAIKESKADITIYGCQFFIQYKNYLSLHMNDVDYDLDITPHMLLLNGKHNYNLSNKQLYREGVSLRYKNIFSFEKTSLAENIILFGSYVLSDTKYMLECVSSFKKVVFKNHPAVKIEMISKLDNNIIVSNDDAYKLFNEASIVIGTSTGTCLEAVACAIPVIIIASKDNLTVNPLVDYGKGKIWDVAFSKDDVKMVYNKLIEYKKNNSKELEDMALWYRNQFFIEPTESQITDTFDLSNNDFKNKELI